MLAGATDAAAHDTTFYESQELLQAWRQASGTLLALHTVIGWALPSATQQQRHAWLWKVAGSNGRMQLAVMQTTEACVQAARLTGKSPADISEGIICILGTLMASLRAVVMYTADRHDELQLLFGTAPASSSVPFSSHQELLAELLLKHAALLAAGMHQDLTAQLGRTSGGGGSSSGDGSGASRSRRSSDGGSGMNTSSSSQAGCLLAVPAWHE